MPASSVLRDVPITICGHSFKHDLLVADLNPRLDVIIGLDLFKKINLYIGGLKSLNSDFSDDYVDETEPAVSITQVDEELRKMILKNIQSLIDENLATISDFCSLEDSVVSLDTGTNIPSFVKQYPVPVSLRPVVDQQLKEWLESGVVVPLKSASPWNSPLLVVKKASMDDKPAYRVVLDPRHINSKLADDTYPIPIIKELLEQLSGSSIFSKLDLKASYHQFYITPSDQTKTSFTWQGCRYHFQGSPFGIKILTSVFQRVMSNLFSDMPFVVVYIDDIVVHSKNPEQHQHHLQQVISRLTSVKLTLNQAKCQFACTSIQVLGHNVSKAGIAIDKDKFSHVQSWPIPTTGKDIQSFLGLMNFFRDFIPQYASISRPLDELRLQGNITGVWTNAHQRSFEALKAAFESCATLSFPDPDKKLYLETDASGFAIAGCLFHLRDENGNPLDVKNRQYIRFLSRGLRKHEPRYSATKRELLAVVFSLRKLEGLLLGRPFTVICDHQPLSYLQSQQKLDELHLKWAETLFRFNYDIVYRPGKDNQIADALSRLFPDARSGSIPVTEDAPLSCPVLEPSVSSVVSTTPDTAIENVPIVASATASQRTSSDAVSVTPVVQSASPSQPDAQLPNQALQYGKRVPPEQERATLIQQLHSLVHSSADDLYSRLWRSGVFWESMRKDCESVVSSCKQCLSNNISREGFHPLHSITASQPWDHIAIDLTGPLPNRPNGPKYLLIVIDAFSRFIILRALTERSATTVSKELLDIFSLLGHPRIIQSDNGGEFVNDIAASVALALGIDHRTITPGHSRGNGLAERAVRSSIDLLVKQIHGHGPDWHLDLPLLQWSINQRIIKYTRTTPFAAMFGRMVNPLSLQSCDAGGQPLPEPKAEEINQRLDILRSVVYPEIDKANIRAKNQDANYWNSKHKLVNFPRGTFVMVRNPNPRHKLDIRFIGPYQVNRITKGGTYILSDGNGLNLSKPFAPVSLKLVNATEATKEYFCEDIVDHMTHRGQMLFRVRWFGYSPSEDSWEPRESFPDPSIVDNYLEGRRDDLGGE